MAELRNDSHPDEDRLNELALGGLPAADEAEILLHLSGCRSCHAEYDEVVRALDAVLPASPAIPPPAGFDQRVLTAIGVSGPVPSRRPGRVALLVSAAAIAGLVAGAVVTATAPDSDEEPAAETSLVTAQGDVVGDLLVGYYEGDQVLVMNIEDGPPGRHYTCRLRLDDGSTRSGGEWTLPASGDAVWITPLTEGVQSVELVSDSGAVWSTATLRD